MATEDNVAGLCSCGTGWSFTDRNVGYVVYLNDVSHNHIYVRCSGCHMPIILFIANELSVRLQSEYPLLRIVLRLDPPDFLREGLAELERETELERSAAHESIDARFDELVASGLSDVFDSIVVDDIPGSEEPDGGGGDENDGS